MYLDIKVIVIWTSGSQPENLQKWLKNKEQEREARSV